MSEPTDRRVTLRHPPADGRRGLHRPGGVKWPGCWSRPPKLMDRATSV
jgi:hypothetical protein